MNGKWHHINQGKCWAIKQARVYIRLYKLPTKCDMAQEINLKEQKQVLNGNRDFIIDNLDPDDVSDELIQDHLMGDNAAQKVSQSMGLSRQEKNRIIVDQLSISGLGAIEKFWEILRRKKRQLFIAEKLENCKYKA